MTAKIIELKDCDDILKTIKRKYIDTGMRYGWKSNNNQAYDYGHWNTQILYGNNMFPFDHNRMPYIDHHPEVREIWNIVQQALGGRSLFRAYINGYTYGTDAYYHVDEKWIKTTYGSDTESETVIVYLNENWNKDWGGETSVVDENGEIEMAVLPKFGRMFIFDSNKEHSARPLSRACPSLRSVLVFKTMGKTVTSPQIEFIEKHTKDLQHLNKSLFEHLLNTNSLLVRNGYNRDVCAAGLFHSIYGTPSYHAVRDKNISRDEVRELIGEYAEKLVHTYCNINGRTEYFLDDSTPLGIQERHDLILIEIANCIDQNSDGRYNDTISMLDAKIQGMKK